MKSVVKMNTNTTQCWNWSDKCIPNSSGKQYNLEKLYSLSQIPLNRFETMYFPNPLLVNFPNPPRAIWDSVFSLSTFNVFPKFTKDGLRLTNIDGDSAEDSDTTTR